MPRIRTVKPDFWTDEKIGRLKREERLLFIGLWNLADDQGVIKNSSVYIKGQLFSYDDDLRTLTIDAWLASLIMARMLVPFRFEAESYLCIRTFDEHQLINRPSKAKFSKDLLAKIKNTHGVLTEYSQQEGKGKEGKGKEGIEADKSPPIKTFKNFSEQDFIEEIKKFSGQFEKSILNNFFKYWKELSPGGKMRFQLEKTWQTNLRLEKWKANQLNFNHGTDNKNSNGGKHGAKNDGAYNLLNEVERELGIT